MDKFSELLTEYLELRDEGEIRSDWRSIDDLAAENRKRRERMAELLRGMDRITGQHP